MAFILYEISNTVNDKKYIGQTTKSLNSRWSGHLSSVGISKTPLYSDMKTFGADKFNISELCRVDNLDELNELEAFIIQEKGTLSPIGYNIARGDGNAERDNEQKILNSGLQHKDFQFETDGVIQDVQVIPSDEVMTRLVPVKETATKRPLP